MIRAIIALSLVLMLNRTPSIAEVPETNNYVLSVTDGGISPKSISLSKDDSILLFLNKTKESLITIEIDFGSNEIHCSSGNLKKGDDGKLRSARPIAPKDFASTCFHAEGKYPATVYGLASYPAGLKTTINVY